MIINEIYFAALAGCLVVLIAVMVYLVVLRLIRFEKQCSKREGMSRDDIYEYANNVAERRKVEEEKQRQQWLEWQCYREKVNQLCSESEQGNLENVAILLEDGVDVNAENDDDFTPLFLATGSGNLEVVKYLVEHGAVVNAKTEDGTTPLHFTAMRDNLEAVKYLVELGADVRIKNSDGQTAKDITQSNEVKRFLEEAESK